MYENLTTIRELVQKNFKDIPIFEDYDAAQDLDQATEELKELFNAVFINKNVENFSKIGQASSKFLSAYMSIKEFYYLLDGAFYEDLEEEQSTVIKIDFNEDDYDDFLKRLKYFKEMYDECCRIANVDDYKLRVKRVESGSLVLVIDTFVEQLAVNLLSVLIVEALKWKFREYDATKSIKKFMDYKSQLVNSIIVKMQEFAQEYDEEELNKSVMKMCRQMENFLRGVFSFAVGDEKDSIASYLDEYIKLESTKEIEGGQQESLPSPEKEDVEGNKEG